MFKIEQFMNNGLPSHPEDFLLSLDERFADKPHVRKRLLEIADVLDQLVAQGCTAHQAEAKAIDDIYACRWHRGETRRFRMSFHVAAGRRTLASYSRRTRRRREGMGRPQRR